MTAEWIDYLTADLQQILWQQTERQVCFDEARGRHLVQDLVPWCAQLLNQLHLLGV